MLTPRTLGLIAETRLTDLNLSYQAETVESSGVPVWLMAIVIIGIVGIAIGIKYVQNNLTSDSKSPSGLLLEVCNAHGLNGRQGKLLNKIANGAQLAQPASLLLSVDGYNAAIKKATRSAKLSSRDQAVLDDLRTRLFAR